MYIDVSLCYENVELIVVEVEFFFVLFFMLFDDVILLSEDFFVV